MFKWSIESLEKEAKEEIIKNMILAYPGHFIMPWTLYFLTDIAQIRPWVFSIFAAAALLNSSLHFLMGLAYPIFRNLLGQGRWDKFYILTVSLEAISFVAPVLYFQNLYGLWTQETIFASILWVIGLEGFVKFCYQYPQVFKLVFSLMVLPLAILSPYLSGMTGTIFALSVCGYSLVVYNGAFERLKQAINLQEITKQARRDEEKLKDLLYLNSFLIFELNELLDIQDASRAPLYPQVSWYLPPELKKEIGNFKKSDRKNDSFEMKVRLERESIWYQFNLRKDEDRVKDKETIYLVAFDIDNKKQIELELEEQKASQITNSKLAALGEMAGGIAHEINNPLTILSGNVFKIKRSLKKDSYSKDDLIASLEKMESTIKRISKIIIGLRNLSHPGHASLEKTNLSGVVEDTIGLCQEKFLSHGVRLINNIEVDNELFVKCGHIEFGQILLNLINNAFDIIKNQEEKTIYLRLGPGDSKKNISIEVCDNGPGAKDPSKLFNPFYTTKDVGEGTGLGLSLSRKIAESHSGSLNYYRENDLTVFKLTLPLWQEEDSRDDAA